MRRGLCISHLWGCTANCLDSDNFHTSNGEGDPGWTLTYLYADSRYDRIDDCAQERSTLEM